MNNFLEEKEKLLNSIENNTTKHWKEYYKDVPLDCIFEDLVIDINEIKRLTKENKQLKEQLQQKEDIINKANNYVIDNANIYLNFIGNKVGFFKENDGKTPIELLKILDNKGE